MILHKSRSKVIFFLFGLLLWAHTCTQNRLNRGHTFISTVYQGQKPSRRVNFPCCAWGFSHQTLINANKNHAAQCHSTKLLFSLSYSGQNNGWNHWNDKSNSVIQFWLICLVLWVNRLCNDQERHFEYNPITTCGLHLTVSIFSGFRFVG